MKFTKAATTLFLATAVATTCTTTSVHGFAHVGKTTTTAFAPPGGGVNTSHGGPTHKVTRNNLGRRKIKAWHRLELQPWAGLKMSAAVDEPTSSAGTAAAGGGGSGGGVGMVNGVSVAEQQQQQQAAAAAAAAGGIGTIGGFYEEMTPPPTATATSTPTTPMMIKRRITPKMLASGIREQSLSYNRDRVANDYLSRYVGETGASVIYGKLQDHGVTVVNGYSGGAILPLLDHFHEDHPRHHQQVHHGSSCQKKPMIRWITNSNESSAGHVAEGIAKSSTEVSDGKLAAGVVVATSGPGVTNLVTPLQDAICDGVPMVVLCGQAATTAPEGAFQFAPAVDITKPCTKWSYQITSAVEVPFVMDYAFYIAREGRPGPVFIDLPKDLQNQVITPEGVTSFVDGLKEMHGGSSQYHGTAGGEEELPFVKFVERKLLDESSEEDGEVSMHAIHLGSIDEGLPFRISPTEKGKLQAVPVDEQGTENDEFRMDHTLTHSIYKLDGTRGELFAPTDDDGSNGISAVGSNNRSSWKSSHSSHMREMIQIIKKAKKPIILAGQGCNDAPSELLQLAELLRIPVTTTLHGLGCFDERHPLALNMVGMHGHPTPNFMVQECDLIISIGSRFDDRITGNPNEYIPEAKRAAEELRGGVIHVDVRLSEKGKQVTANYFVHTTGKDFLRCVLDELRTNHMDTLNKEHTAPWLDRMYQLQRDFPVHIPTYDTITTTDGTTGTPTTKTPMSTQAVIAVMNDLLLQANEMDNSIFSTGVGIHQMVAAQLLTWTKPRQMISSGSLGTMGVALGYCIGAKLANPQCICIAVDGDGSFNMTFTELKTVAEQNIPIKILILDNESQMMVEYWQKLFCERRLLAVRNEKNPEYTMLADAFGIKNLFVDSAENLESSMQKFLFDDPDEPVLMHVKVERTPCLPLVAPGQALDNMILVDVPDQEVDQSATPS